MNTNFELEQLDKQISSVFKNPAAAEKYNQLIEQKQNLISNQTSGEQKKLEREIDEIRQRQANSGAKRYQLLQVIAEKADAVRIIEPQLEAAQRKLNQANLELSFFEQSVSQDRTTLKKSTTKLNKLTGATNEQN